MRDFLAKFDSARLITGVLMVVVILVIVLINNQNLVAFLLFLASVVGYFEACKLYQTSSNFVLFAYISAFVLAYFTSMPMYAGLFCLVFSAGIYAYKGCELKNLLPLIYPLIPILCIYQVYVTYDMYYLFWIVFVVGICDSCAYFIGKMFGKTKFSSTSPNKTLEGVLGGVFVASLLGTIYGIFNESLADAFVISFFMAVFAVFGDLFESLLKRLADVKDSGDLFPGHGGILDRIDASMFACFAMIFLV